MLERLLPTVTFLLATGSALAAGPVAPLVAIESDSPYVVLSATVDAAWTASAAPEVTVAAEGRYESRVRVDEARLPAALRASKPASVAVYGAGGVVCQGRVTDVWVVKRAYIDPITLDGDVTATLATPEGKKAISERLAGVSGGEVLAARIEPSSGQCAGALYALPSDTRPTPYAVEKGDDALRRKAIAALRATDFHRRTQKEYVAFVKTHPPQEGEPANPAHWDELEGGVTVTKLTPAGGAKGPTLVVVSAWETSGCGDFFRASGAVVYELNGTFLKARSSTTKPLPAFDPEAALDLESDGRPEFVIPGGFVLPTKDGYGHDDSAQPADTLCPC